MREFLPYKHYRVLDSQWTSCCSSEVVRFQMPLAGRLQGVTAGSGSGAATVLLPRAYAFTLSIAETNDGSGIPVRFALRPDDAGGSGRGSQATSERISEARVADIRAEMENLNAQIQKLQARVEVGLAPADELRMLRDRLAQLERRLVNERTSSGQGGASGSRAIIDSGFTMAVGETVVVGTSRLGGDKALIALVTAVRRSAPSR